MTLFVNTIIIILIIAGTIFTVVAAIGLIRLPDIYARTHAASKSSTLGVLCILIGTLLHFTYFENQFNSRLILGIIFLFITAPIAGHLISRAAYVSGVPLAKEPKHDDLKEALKKQQK